MRVRLALGAWLFALCVSAEGAEPPAALVGASSAYQAELTAARKVMQREESAARKRYIAKLAELQKSFTMRGDLDGALAVKRELEACRAINEHGFPEGDWTVTVVDGEGDSHLRKYIFRGGRGELNLGDMRHRLALTARDGMLIVRREDGAWEHWQVRADGRYIVDYYGFSNQHWGAGIASPNAP
jgi:hypothetical protein